MDKGAVKVSIYGSEYVIKGDTSADHVRAVARYVDQKMREVNNQGMIKSPLKVAILAALNIADEYFKARDEQRQDLDSMEQRIQKLVDLVHQKTSQEPQEEPEAPPTPAISLFSQD